MLHTAPPQRHRAGPKLLPLAIPVSIGSGEATEAREIARNSFLPAIENVHTEPTAFYQHGPCR